MDVSAWIAHWAGWTPDRTALRFEDRPISYAELEQEVAATAGWLRTCGIRPGERVGYLGPNCPELLELLFACARLGAVFVPLNARMPAAELRVFTTLTQPRVLVAERGFAQVGEALGQRVATFAIGEQVGSSGAAPVFADPGADPTRPVLIVFTSGTTGRPKGAVFTHANLAVNALNVLTAFGLGTTDEILTAVPMFHAGGLLIHTTPALCAGAAVTVHRQFDPGLLLRDVARHRVTLLASVPTMTAALAAHPAWEHADLRSLRQVVTGSTVVPPTAITAWQRRGIPVTQVYGSTETCPLVTCLPPGSPDAAAHTAGKPVLHNRIRVVDSAGHDASAGARGEVWIRGAAVMQGYWDNAEATRAAFHDGWYRTGDVGLLDGAGYLHIVDRMTDVIMVGSSNVYPGDLEAVLDACTEVREAAVVGRSDDALGEVPIACVVPAPGHSPTRERVLGWFTDRLAPYKHPRDVVFLDALPRNATGKVERAVLHELVARSRPASSEIHANATTGQNRWTNSPMARSAPATTPSVSL